MSPGADEVYADYRCAELLLEMNQPADAVRLLDAVVPAAPGSTAVLELLARALFASAQLARAEEVLRELVERRPDDGWPRLALARTLERQSRRAEAAEQRRVAAALGLLA